MQPNANGRSITLLTKIPNPYMEYA